MESPCLVSAVLVVRRCQTTDIVRMPITITRLVIDGVADGCSASTSGSTLVVTTVAYTFSCGPLFSHIYVSRRTLVVLFRAQSP